MVGEGPNVGQILHRSHFYYSSQNFSGFSIGVPIRNAQSAGDPFVVVPDGYPVVVGDTVALNGFIETITAITPVGLGDLQISLQGGVTADVPAGAIMAFRPGLLVHNAAGVATTPLSQFESSLPFVTPFVLNEINPVNLVVATSSVYESTDNGRTLTRLRTASGGTSIGKIKPLVYGGRQPDGLGGSVDTPTVLYVGTDPTAGRSPTTVDTHALWHRSANAA